LRTSTSSKGESKNPEYTTLLTLTSLSSCSLILLLFVSGYYPIHNNNFSGLFFPATHLFSGPDVINLSFDLRETVHRAQLQILLFLLRYVCSQFTIVALPYCGVSGLALSVYHSALLHSPFAFNDIARRTLPFTCSPFAF